MLNDAEVLSAREEQTADLGSFILAALRVRVEPSCAAYLSNKRPSALASL